MYNEVMKTVQCAHLPHHYSGFVAAWWLWQASGEKAACLKNNSKGTQANGKR